MEEGFEVHGHDEELLEHKVHGGDDLSMRIAVLTAILSTLGAVFSYAGGAAQNEAMMLKNDAVLKKAAASDQWAFYQAKSQKQLISESLGELSEEPRASVLKAKAARYEKEKAEIKIEAEKLDKESLALDEQSAHALHPHHRIAQGMTLIQVGIALASIAALTRKRWLVAFAGTAATIGVAIAAMGLFV